MIACDVTVTSRATNVSWQEDEAAESPPAETLGKVSDRTRLMLCLETHAVDALVRWLPFGFEELI